MRPSYRTWSFDTGVPSEWTSSSCRGGRPYPGSSLPQQRGGRTTIVSIRPETTTTSTAALSYPPGRVGSPGPLRRVDRLVLWGVASIAIRLSLVVAALWWIARKS
jgi:hypothetical protein